MGNGSWIFVTLQDSFSTKWNDVLPPNLPLRWTAVWRKLMFEKEVAFMWSIIHKEVAQEWVVWPHINRGWCEVPSLWSSHVKMVKFVDRLLIQWMWRYGANRNWKLRVLSSHNGFWKSFLLCGNVCLIRVRLLFCDNVNSFGFTLGMKFYGTFGGREIIHCLTKCNGYLEGERKIRVILDALVDMARLRGRMLLSIRTRQLRLLNINSSMDLIGLGKW